MTESEDGSLEFNIDGVLFRFEKENYEKHVLKRPKINAELAQIEDTLRNYDCLTWGPKTKSKKNYYKVLSYKDARNIRFVTFWKIPVYHRSKKLAIIATAIYSTSPNFYVVNQLESLIWKDPNSQI